MSLLESLWLSGAACDVRGCTVQELLPELVPAWGLAQRAFEDTLLDAGWAKRIGRSVRWYCPTHAHMASRCAGGSYGQCSQHCPVHHGGRVVTSSTR
jgi:hypothetical protein